LFYSLPLLFNRLPALYWHHYALLVCAVHILLGDNIDPSQVNATEKMITDFHALLPELYGEASCTHNAHLLSHLPRFVRLWGPLWTHSTFDFESKHNQLKHLFHGKHHIVQQLLFNVDIDITLQLLFPRLLQTETDNTMTYLSRRKHQVSRPNMSLISEHNYVVGVCNKVNLSPEQASVLGLHSARVFNRLCKDGVLYYAAQFHNGYKGKRNDTICCYIEDGRVVRFGQIELFSLDPFPLALLYPFQFNSISLMQKAGNPCRPVLQPYREIDLLSSIFHLCKEPSLSSTLVAVKTDSILAKSVLVETNRNTIVISQPNNYECH